MMKNRKTSNAQVVVFSLRRKLEDLFPYVPDEHKWRVKNALKDVEHIAKAVVFRKPRKPPSNRDCRWWLMWRRDGAQFLQIVRLHKKYTGRKYTHEHIRRCCQIADERLRAGEKPEDVTLHYEIDKTLKKLYVEEENCEVRDD